VLGELMVVGQLLCSARGAPPPLAAASGSEHPRPRAQGCCGGFVAGWGLVRQSETIAEIRVHGNHISSDADILALSGLTIGAPFTATTIADVKAKLKRAGRFDDIDVLKRYASIADPTRIVVVIVVNEGPVRIEVPRDPAEPVQVVKRNRFKNILFMPILDGEDGYGFTYGARLAYVGLVGKRSRVSFPLTWGGMKRAGAEFEHNFSRGPFTRLEVGTAVQRQENPAFEINDDRTRVWARADRSIQHVRLSATTSWQRITFDTLHDDVRSVGGEAVFDTRLDPVLPRNAVFATAAVDRLFFEDGDPIVRTRVDARGYVGVYKQNVVVVRALRQDADRPLPPYFKSLLGGWSTLRGFEAGSFTGDTLVAGSIELRIPLSSPISVGKLGVSVFADAGKAYDKGSRFRDARLEKGVGGSVWITLAAFRISLGVAHGLGASTRVNFGGGLTF
jgi:outer membrane protein assembly factor BamA